MWCVYIYSGCYSALKTKIILLHATIYMILEDTLLNEISQLTKKSCIVPLIWGIYSGQSPRNREWNSGYRGWGRRVKGVVEWVLSFRFIGWKCSGDQFPNSVYILNTDELWTIHLKMVSIYVIWFCSNKKISIFKHWKHRVIREHGTQGTSTNMVGSQWEACGQGHRGWGWGTRRNPWKTLFV